MNRIYLSLTTLFLSSAAHATTFTFTGGTFHLRTALRIDSAVSYVSCVTDKWSGEGDQQMTLSNYQMVTLHATPGGYDVSVYPASVEYSTFMRTFLGCNLMLTQISGYDPALGLPINSMWSDITLGGSAESKTDSEELIKATIQNLEGCQLGGIRVVNPDHSQPTWHCQ